MSDDPSTVAISLPRDEHSVPASSSGSQTSPAASAGESPQLISTERDGHFASHLGIAGRIAAAFIDSKLTPLVVIASVLLGAAAIVLLPREEEPQIKVPMIDVMVAMPGSTAKEIEERATRPMEKLLWEVPGVEYLYSTSRDSESLVIVRFKVGEDPERSLVKITEKLRSNFDRMPMGVTMPIIKPTAIDVAPTTAVKRCRIDALLCAEKRSSSGPVSNHVKVPPTPSTVMAYSTPAPNCPPVHR